jgi:hypothetical protein
MYKRNLCSAKSWAINAAAGGNPGGLTHCYCSQFGKCRRAAINKFELVVELAITKLLLELTARYNLESAL